MACPQSARLWTRQPLTRAPCAITDCAFRNVTVTCPDGVNCPGGATRSLLCVCRAHPRFKKNNIPNLLSPFVMLEGLRGSALARAPPALTLVFTIGGEAYKNSLGRSKRPAVDVKEFVCDRNAGSTGNHRRGGQRSRRASDARSRDCGTSGLITPASKRRSSMNALKHGECSAVAIRARAERAATMREARRLMAKSERRPSESLRGGW